MGEEMQSRSAFTLIELLIVVAIIGILAAIAVPNFLNAQIRAKVAKSISNVNILRDAYIQYGLDNRRTPEHSDVITAQDRLTTPMAYINSRIPDVFKEGLEERGLKAPHAGLYHAEPYTEIMPLENMKTSFPNLYEGFKAGHSGVVLGYGPSQEYDYIEYDSSNGIRSRGAIYNWVPRFHQKDFATP